MKLTERNAGLYLEDITRDDIRFANLAGRLTGSRYDDPNKPKHEYVVWIDDPKILDKFREMNVTISEKVDPETEESRFSVRFKAYPRMSRNPRTGKDELRDNYPKLILTLDDIFIENRNGIRTMNVVDFLTGRGDLPV